MQAAVASFAVPAAFALGHALPLAGIAFGAQRFERLLHLWPAYATQTVAAALAIAVGAYYWLLA
jgi:cytochrome c biogenesis protein CcdA